MHILIALILVVAGGTAVHRHLTCVRCKMRRDFRRLRRSILRRIDDKSRRREVRRLLKKCREHLDAMCDSQHEHEVIGKLIDSAEALSGVRAIEARERTNAFKTGLGMRLAEFFAALSRLSTSANLEEVDSVAELREFTRSLHKEQHAFLQLTRELSNQELVVTKEAS